jgi:hypothetical protein
MVAELKTKEDRVEAIRHTADLLAHLSFRCFPTYRPVIGGYLAILSNLGEGKTDEIETMMANLKTYREAEMKRFAQLTDLMDWYHLTSVREESGEFDDYLRVRENLRESSVGRQDPVNRYLDKVQKLFARD